ncbi:MAG TPA: hypothetical protein VMV92_22650 [Streptosporangiaceae bacterium]|nr:hypothetical protein [Streptosporangiaceae bacterium]
MKQAPDQIDPAHTEHARRVADAILFEGYLLYPYRATAQKNQERFQFGVLMPPAYRSVDEHEPSATRTECVLECAADARITVLTRFLQLQRRAVQTGSPGAGFRPVDSLRVGDTEHIPWDEAAEREQEVTAPLSQLLSGGAELSFTVPGGMEEEDLATAGGQVAGRLIRRREALRGVIRLGAERLPGPYGALRLRVALENHTEPGGPLARRADGLPFALIAAHSLIAVPSGRFLSMTSPPEWAAAEVGGCVNTGTWPVLAGPEGCTELMLSSPVILYDHPEIAAESAGQLFDSTEIDEILTLRTLTLTDAEKRAARSTDPRAAELMDRLDHLPPEMLERMHGAIRYLRPASGATARPGNVPPGGIPEAGSVPQIGGIPQPGGVPGDVPGLGGLAGGGLPGDPATAGQAPWWDPGADRSVSPETDHIVIGGVRVTRGSRVRMCPGTRRADAQDLFLSGRTALVEAVLFDVDGNAHLALIPDDDPAAELQRSHGRFLYFAPDEVEPIGAAS